jgi:hypothetical protein
MAVLGHEADVSWLTPVGGLTAVQVNPPSVVIMIVEPDPAFPLFPMAAQSSVAEQETPVR